MLTSSPMLHSSVHIKIVACAPCRVCLYVYSCMCDLMCVCVHVHMSVHLCMCECVQVCMLCM